MQRLPLQSMWIRTFRRFLVVLSVATPGWSVAIADDPVPLREYRDTHPTIDQLDSIRVLSADKAAELQDEFREMYRGLAPSVVRIWMQDAQSRAFDEDGLPVGGGVSGVIIGPKGLILTCSHHRLKPGAGVTIELADGKRVPGKALGRFEIDDPKGSGPDLGLVASTESQNWPAVPLADGRPSAAGGICLSIGYPGTLRPGSPPLLRAGRIIAGAPGWPWLEATTTGVPGDSGGPIFDKSGRVLGVVCSADAGASVQSVEPLETFRDRLEADELISNPSPPIRAMRARVTPAGPIRPALDLEDRLLQIRRSVIAILDGPHEIACGLIVDRDGWAITKASLVGSRRDWSCRTSFKRGRPMIHRGRVVATSAEHDVALLKLDGQDFPIAQWAVARPDVGTLVSTIFGRAAGQPPFGVVGAETRPEPARLNDSPQILINVKANAAGEPEVYGSGPATAEFDAHRELLEAGDLITHVNGSPTPTTHEFGRLMDRLLYAPHASGEGVDYNRAAPGSFVGDWVSIGLRRGTAERTIQIPKIHSTTMDEMEWNNHPLSLRRESFPAVFAHDASLRPEQCGGPVVDLNGHIVGLNIARADATRTLAIPADVLQTLIAELRNQSEAEAR